MPARGESLLQTRAMTASAKGAVDAPGQNVRQKSGLNHFILATGWSGLRVMSAYKAPRLIAAAPPAHEPDVRRLRPRRRPLATLAGEVPLRALCARRPRGPERGLHPALGTGTAARGGVFGLAESGDL